MYDATSMKGVCFHLCFQRSHKSLRLFVWGFFVMVVSFFWFLKSTGQLLKSKVHGEIIRFLLGSSLIAEIALVVQNLSIKKLWTVMLFPDW